MDIIAFLLIFALACGGLGMVLRLHLYPTSVSKLEFAFSSKYRDRRQALHVARRRKSDLNKEYRKKYKEIARPFDEKIDVIRAKIRELKRKERGLRQQGRGELRLELWKLRLYEHGFEFPESTSREEQEVDKFKQVSLVGLGIGISWPPECSLIEIAHDGIRYRPIEIPLSKFDRREVKHFVNCVEDAIKIERESQISQRAQEAELDAQIKKLRVEIGVVGEARDHKVAEARNARRGDQRQKEADAAWDKQRDAWEELTGSRPNWPCWWRR